MQKLVSSQKRNSWTEAQRSAECIWQGFSCPPTTEPGSVHLPSSSSTSTLSVSIGKSKRRYYLNSSSLYNAHHTPIRQGATELDFWFRGHWRRKQKCQVSNTKPNISCGSNLKTAGIEEYLQESGVEDSIRFGNQIIKWISGTVWWINLIILRQLLSTRP